MKKVLLPILLFVMFLQTASSQTDGINSWTVNFGIDARVYGMVNNPANQSIMYFCSIDSGMYKTTNTGLSWFPVNTGLTYKNVISLAICNGTPNVLYAGTDQNGSTNSGVYKSTDAGATWTYASNGITDTKAIQALAVNPANPNIAFACVFDGVNASSVGLWKTTDGGGNWVASSTGMTNMNILSVLINPLNPNVMYAGSSLVLPGSTGPSKIFKSNNGGSSWFDVSNGLPTGTTTGDPVRCMSMSTLDTSVVIAGLFVNDTAGGVYVTMNGGTSWAKKYGGLPNTTGTLIRSIMIRPGTSNQFYIGLDQSAAASPKGIYRSIDGGVTFSDFASGSMSNTYGIRGILFKTTGDTTLYLGAATATLPGKGTFEYTWPSPLPIWTPVDSLGISLNCVSTVNANVAWIGGAGGKVLKTTNGGASFVQMTNATIGANDIYAIAGIDANTCLVSTSPAATFVFKTTDGGTTFTQVFTQVSGFIDDIRMQNATTGFMYGDPVGLRWSLWKTTNAGTTWDSTGCYLPQAGTESGYNNAMCLRGNTIWFGTGNTRVYKSTNFGATGSWISGATTGSANSYSVSFNGAVGFSGTTAAVKSTDGGATYTGVTVPGSGNLFAFNGIPNTGRFWFCRGASIYNSTDNGATFNTTPQYTRTGTFQAMDIKLDGTIIRGFAVTALGIIARFNEGGVVTSITPISTTTTPDSYQLGQNYPNPFNPTTKINFALPKSGLVTLKVYDAVGKEVATLVNEVKNVGTYSVDFNASNLSSGIYFYKVSVNGFNEVKKMMLIK